MVVPVARLCDMVSTLLSSPLYCYQFVVRFLWFSTALYYVSSLVLYPYLVLVLVCTHVKPQTMMNMLERCT